MDAEIEAEERRLAAARKEGKQTLIKCLNAHKSKFLIPNLFIFDQSKLSRFMKSRNQKVVIAHFWKNVRLSIETENIPVSKKDVQYACI